MNNDTKSMIDLFVRAISLTDEQVVAYAKATNTPTKGKVKPSKKRVQRLR